LTLGKRTREQHENAGGVAVGNVFLREQSIPEELF
jgi:hypothetical protein